MQTKKPYLNHKKRIENEKDIIFLGVCSDHLVLL